MSVPVLLDLLSELRKRDKMRGLPSIYLFRNYFNKINDTGVYLSHDIKITLNRIFSLKTSLFCHLLRNFIMYAIT